MQKLKYNNYILNLELIYRNKKDNYKIPKFKKLSLNINIENTQNYFNLINLNAEVIKSNLFLYFYLIFFKVPFCSFSAKKDLFLKFRIAKHSKILDFFFEFSQWNYIKTVNKRLSNKTFFYDKEKIKLDSIAFFDDLVELNQSFIYTFFKSLEKKDLSQLIILILEK